MAFILNTGTHKNGGTHWQSMYIDHEHTVYFFDSYGRKPSDIFHRFAHDLLTISYYREYTKDLSLREALSDSKFTQTNLRQCHKTKEANDEEDTIRYFPYQIQNDKTNVCGEYAVLFLHNITRTRDPWMHAYEFWTDHQDVFFYYLHPPHTTQSALVAAQQQTIQRQHNKIEHYHLDKQRLNIKIKNCIITM